MEETEIVKEEEPKVKVNSMAALWEERLKEKEREVAETTHLTWKTEKPRYLSWNRENLHFKPKPLMSSSATYDDGAEEENTLDDCSSISDTEVDRQSDIEAEFGEQLDDEINETLDGTEEEEEEKANSSSETSSSEEESASYQGGPEVGSLRQMFEQLGGSSSKTNVAQYKEPMGDRNNMYQGASTAPELRQVSMQPPVASPRKAVSMELQGRGREDGEITSDDETHSETANRGGGSTFEEDTQGKEDTTSEDEEEQDQWNERMEDPEEGVKRIGRLPENLLQPFLSNTHPTQQHHIHHEHHQELELERSHDHSAEDEKYSTRQARSSSASSEGEEDLRSSGDHNEYAPYTPLMRWHSSDNDASHRKEREDSESEEEDRMVKQQLPSERKTSVKELRDKFARGRILETVKRKEEEEEELRHIPEDLRQFFRNTSSSKKECFIDEIEQAEISNMVNRFKQEEIGEEHRQAEEATPQVSGGDFGFDKIEKEETAERVRRLSMERLSLFKIPS